MAVNTNISEFAPKTEFLFYDKSIEVAFLKGKDIIPIGLDIGYSSTKVCSIFGKHIFPSFPIRMAEDSTVFDKETNIKYKDENGDLWYVGGFSLQHT